MRLIATISLVMFLAVSCTDFSRGYTANEAGNYKEAVKWYRQAAERGDAGAQNNLGVMYNNGEGVIKNDKTAVKWFRQAAVQGNALAQFNLGLMYARGEGVARDYNEAAEWYRQAAEQGMAGAQNSLGLTYEYGWGVAQNNKTAYMFYLLALANTQEDEEERELTEKNVARMERKLTAAQKQSVQDMAAAYQARIDAR
ncbi:MAG: tetratricopeptide repeat protein [Parvibaculales bacterium]